MCPAADCPPSHRMSLMLLCIHVQLVLLLLQKLAIICWSGISHPCQTISLPHPTFIKQGMKGFLAGTPHPTAGLQMPLEPRPRTGSGTRRQLWPRPHSKARHASHHQSACPTPPPTTILRFGGYGYSSQALLLLKDGLGLSMLEEASLSNL